MRRDVLLDSELVVGARRYPERAAHPRIARRTYRLWDHDPADRPLRAPNTLRGKWPSPGSPSWLPVGLPFGPPLGVVLPSAPGAAAVGCLGDSFRLPSPGPGDGEGTGSFAFGGTGIAAPAGFEVTPGPLERSELDLGSPELRCRV